MRSIVITVGALFAGCAADIQPGTEPGTYAAHEEQLTLAEIQYGDARISFDQLAGSQVAVVARQPEGQRSVLLDENIVGLRFDEMYEYWTGERAPLALEQALDRAAVAAADLELNDPSPFAEDEDEGERALGSTAAALTGTEFRTAFCDNMAHQYCLLDETGGQTISSRAWLLGAYAHARVGDIKVELRLDRFVGGWESRGTWPVLEGETWNFSLDWSGQTRRPLAVRIKEADGDRYHLQVWFFR